MKITVILCTFNRQASLARALDSVAASAVPASSDWEVIVVDNNSTDRTRSLVEDFCRSHPGRFRYLFEPKPGKSNALNAAIRNVQGDVFAFMDDDVIVQPDWLHNLTAHLNDDAWAGAGGRILPQWTGTPPAWLPTGDRYGLAPLAMFDLGSEPCALEESPFGTNMAFRRDVFEKFGGFRTDLGPRPGTEIRNEDTEFGQRVLDGGARLRYEPSAVVYHEVSQKRLQQEYFLRWWFDKGRAEVRQRGALSSGHWQLAGVPLYLFRRLGVWTWRWLVALKQSRRFSRKLNVWGIAGEIQESYRLSRDADRNRNTI